MCALRLRSVAVLLVLALAGHAHAESYHVGRTTARSGDKAAAQFIVFSAEHTADALVLRAGWLNATDKPMPPGTPPTTADVHLTAYAKGGKREAIAQEASFTAAPSSLVPKQAWVGTLTFPWGSAQVPVAELGALELTLPGYERLDFRIDAAQRFTPVDWANAAPLSQLQSEVPPKDVRMAIFPLRLHSLEVKDGALEVVVSFRNTGRLGVTWKGNVALSGQSFTLITTQREQLLPVAVSDSFRKSIAPLGREWAAGEDHLGWVRFPLPHPQAAEQLGIALPGYGITGLRYDLQDRRYHVLPDQTPAPEAVTRTLEAGRLHDEVKHFWTEAGRELARGEATAYLKRFSGEALTGQRLSLRQMKDLPLRVKALELSAAQTLEMQPGRCLRSVRVALTYNLDSLPPDLPFHVVMECDMQCDEDGAWRVDHVYYPRQQPFWLAGYTAFINSEHFLIFHRPGEKAAALAQSLSAQLARGWKRLASTGLPVRARYAAFDVTEKDDFEKLTTRNADLFAGTASATYVMQGGQMRAVNQALFINDYHFLSQPRTWSKEERQTATEHELVHLALADLTRPWTPAWLVEGTAMHFAGQVNSFTRAQLRQRAAPGMTLTLLSSLSHLGAGTDHQVITETEYNYSGEAVRQIVKRHGEATLLGLYAAFAAESPADLISRPADDDSAAAATARVKLTRQVLAKTLPEGSLEALDQQVRAAFR